MVQDILIGTLVQVNDKTESYVQQIIPHGFESLAFTFGSSLKREPAELADKLMPIMRANKIKVGAVSLYCNPLKDDESGILARQELARLIDCAQLFDCDLVTGFTGRVPNCPIPDSIEKFKAVWTPLAEQAARRQLRLAWENCSMGGDWKTGDHNIAHKPAAWELMFKAIPMDNIGLEWEPCHQMVQLIEPMPQLRQWVKKIFHVHGKDATILPDVLAKNGAFGPETFAYHRTPGFGDSNWTDIISELRRGAFKGCIDIEGWHDDIYSKELEMTGQVHALNYLKSCRGGTLVPNPS